MINPANEILGQARQGSVAAIIQVLNERLADIGIRTRAVVEEGMLQLLCEAATPEQLEKTAVIDRVRAELETISPQRIKKVKINSRIVKEEQLLWLAEINRDPDNALLWAEVITLKRPFFIKRWIRDRHLKPAGPIFQDLSEPDATNRPLISNLIGASGLMLFFVGLGWLFQDNISHINPFLNTPATRTSTVQSTLPPLPTPPAKGTRTADITPQLRLPAAHSARPQSLATHSEAQNAAASGAIADVFAEAVRIADQAGIDGQNASTAAEWLDLAARWQRASDLMSQIPEGSEPYEAAQIRIETYKANSQATLQQASNAQTP